MANHHLYTGTKAGTVCGTLLTVLAQIHSADLVRTCILAVVGATVSFVVSLFWRWVVRVWRK